MFNNIGFFAKRRGNGGPGGTSPSPVRTVTVTPVVNSANVVTFNITSNMIGGEPILKYDFTGLSGNIFLDPIQGNVQLDANGSATITRNLNTSLASIPNQTFKMNIYSQANVLFGNSSNVEIRNVSSTQFSGGTTNPVDGYMYQYYTTASRNVFTITKTASTNPWETNQNVTVEVVGGGGAGQGVASGGGGGTGGGVASGNVNITTIATSTNALVGVGGLANDANLTLRNGSGSLAFGISASGGQSGNTTVVSKSVNYMTLFGYYGGRGLGGTTVSGAPIIYDNTPPNFSVIGGSGGAGTSSIIDGAYIGGGGGGGARVSGTVDPPQTYTAIGGTGSSGGGNGGTPLGGTNGAANTGGGGGGGGAANGGSGRIALKYPYRGLNYAIFMPN